MSYSNTYKNEGGGGGEIHRNSSGTHGKVTVPSYLKATETTTTTTATSASAKPAWMQRLKSPNATTKSWTAKAIRPVTTPAASTNTNATTTTTTTTTTNEGEMEDVLENDNEEALAAYGRSQGPSQEVAATPPMTTTTVPSKDIAAAAAALVPSKAIWMPKMGKTSMSTPPPRDTPERTTLSQSHQPPSLPPPSSPPPPPSSSSTSSIRNSRTGGRPRTPPSTQGKLASNLHLLSNLQKLKQLLHLEAGRNLQTKELLQSLDTVTALNNGVPVETTTPLDKHNGTQVENAEDNDNDHGNDKTNPKDTHTRDIMEISTTDHDEPQFYTDASSDDEMEVYIEEIVTDGEEDDDDDDGVEDAVRQGDTVNGSSDLDESSFAPPSRDRMKRQDLMGVQEPLPPFQPTSPVSYAPPPPPPSSRVPSTVHTTHGNYQQNAPPPPLPSKSPEPLPSTHKRLHNITPDHPSSVRDRNTQVMGDDDDDGGGDHDNWCFPHRQEDDSSWVDPYHPVPKDRKKYLAEELKKTSVDLFPEDVESTAHLEKLRAIHEQARSLDLEYDEKVGLMVGRAYHADEQTTSEISQLDATIRVLEMAVPDQRMDVWKLPSQDGSTYRAVGKLSEHKGGKDYRFSYIAQQHTHSASSYADIVRERYFPQEDNEYWAAPARTTAPELPIHISKDGTIKNGPPDMNEDWMPPEINPDETPIVDTTKYYAPSMADEKIFESKSVRSEGSDWLGYAPSGRSARVDFSGNVNTSDDSDTSFVWNPPALTSEQSSISEMEEPQPTSKGKVKPPSEVKVQFKIPSQRPPSPPVTRDRSLKAADSRQEQSVKRLSYEFSPSGRLKFDMNHETIYIGDEDRRGFKRESSQTRTIKMLICCFFIGLVPVALALIIFFVVDPSDSPRAAPTVPSVPSVPPSPSTAPESTPTSAPIAENGATEEALIKFLSNLSTDGGAALRDSDSPQYAAMKWLQTAANEGMYNEPVILQRYALATLYYSTNGIQWTSSAGWMSNEPECDWQTMSVSSIVCNDAGQFVALKLSGNNLAGPIPPELNLLSASLISLELGNNKLTGQIPASLSDLVRLQALQLSQNQLRGTIPTSLGRLTDLKYMHLYLNSLQSTIPTELGQLTELTEIDLGANVLTGRIPTHFGRMQALQSVGLYVNQLTGRIPSQLATIPRLSVLYLDTNALGPSLPDEICASLTFDEFWTDCSDIGGCECCTRCCEEGQACS